MVVLSVYYLELLMATEMAEHLDALWVIEKAHSMDEKWASMMDDVRALSLVFASL